VEIERAGTLGLQLVQALVAQLGGSVSISRAAGTAFQIRLAVAKYRQRI
jgi:two-component sensor histidine kinase